MNWTQEFDDIFQCSLDKIKNYVWLLRDEIAECAPQLAYLKFLEKTGDLDVEYHPDREPDPFPGDSGKFWFSTITLDICLSKAFKREWLNMASALDMSKQDLALAVENFILHEFFHLHQNLTSEKHYDITSAPDALRVLDYQADANAALAAIYLYAENDETFNYQVWRTLYQNVIKAVTRQMYVFNHAQKEASMSAGRFIRHLTWHYQYHRVSNYRKDAHYSELQLLVEPGINIRNIAVAQQKGLLRKDWPDKERVEDAKDKGHLWLTAPNDFGVASLYRFKTTHPAKFQKLFLGIFDNNLTITAPFFLELFDNYKELIGKRIDQPSKVRIGQKPPLPPLPDGPGGIPYTVRIPGRSGIELTQEAPKLMRLAAQAASDTGTRYLPAVATLASTKPQPMPLTHAAAPLSVDGGFDKNDDIQSSDRNEHHFERGA